MTPTALDHLAQYSDAIDSMDYKIYFQVAAGGLRFPGIFTAAAAEAVADIDGHAGTRSRAFVSYPNNVLSFHLNRAISHTVMPKSRGSWKLKAFCALAAGV